MHGGRALGIGPRAISSPLIGDRLTRNAALAAILAFDRAETLQLG
jgi:hypothetical protein